MIIDIPDYVLDNIVILTSRTLENLNPNDFDSRREYLGYVAELSEILEVL